jgi:hypothetical protein
MSAPVPSSSNTPMAMEYPLAPAMLGNPIHRHKKRAGIKKSFFIQHLMLLQVTDTKKHESNQIQMLILP